MLQAIAIKALQKDDLRTKPVRASGGVTIQGLFELTAPLDVQVQFSSRLRPRLRLPIGACVSIQAGGSGGRLGRLESDVYYADADGREQQVHRGTPIRF